MPNCSKLPNDEKLRIIEVLWSDLTATAEAFASPMWHAEELRQTEADFADGRIGGGDWEEVKRELRQQFE